MCIARNWLPQDQDILGQMKVVWYIRAGAMSMNSRYTLTIHGHCRHILLYMVCVFFIRKIHHFSSDTLTCIVNELNSNKLAARHRCILCGGIQTRAYIYWCLNVFWRDKTIFRLTGSRQIRCICNMIFIFKNIINYYKIFEWRTYPLQTL